MSVTTSRQTTRRDVAADRVERARGAVASTNQSRDPLRRRWSRIGGGLLAAVVGAWLFASLYLSADDRVDVLALATSVEQFDVVERSDLRVVRLSTDSEVESIPASRLDEVVGRIAATDLTAGSLLADGQLMSSSEHLVAETEAVVGLLVGPGDAPVSGLKRGATVSVVVRPTAGTSGDIVEVPGWAAEVSDEASSNGDRPVAVVVPMEQAAVVSAAAADRRVSIVVVGG